MRRFVFLGLTIAGALAAPSIGRAGAIPSGGSSFPTDPVTPGDPVIPGDPCAGIPQDVMSALWFQWAYSFPSGANPVQDTTGALSSLGDQGAYFFLAGTINNTPVTRTAVVRPDQFIFIPLVNAVSIKPYNGDNEDELRADAADTLGDVSNLSLKIDGGDAKLPPPTDTLLDYRQKTPAGTFDLTFPDNALYDVPKGTYEAAGVGYWVALNPFTPGTHQIHFTARSVGTGDYHGIVNTQDVTYNVTVTPEPSSLLMIATGSLALFGFSRRGKPRA